jgi:CRISPR-associated endonuclease Csn1
LRGQWRLNQILGSDEKNRADHRQHAIDAIIAACTDPRTIQLLSTAAAAEWQREGSRGLPEIEPPWSGLLDEARQSVLAIIVSHRQVRRLNGPLHADSNYTPPGEQNGQRRSKVRKPLAGLSESELANDDAIVDPRIRRLIRDQLARLREKMGASKKPSDVFASPENHPSITNRDGSQTPIHSTRVWVKAQAFAIRKGDPTRCVAATGGSNFCTQILSVLDSQGNEVAWTDRPVSRLDALRNRNQPESDPLVRFPLFANDFVVMPDRNGEWQVYRVLNVSEGDIEVRLHHDARTSDEVKKSGDRERIRSGALKERRFRKANLSPTGILTDALSGAPLDLKTLEKSVPRKQTRRKPKDKEG